VSPIVGLETIIRILIEFATLDAELILPSDTNAVLVGREPTRSLPARGF
jgi:hypothetical protein